MGGSGSVLGVRGRKSVLVWVRLLLEIDEKMRCTNCRELYGYDDHVSLWVEDEEDVVSEVLCKWCRPT